MVGLGGSIRPGLGRTKSFDSLSDLVSFHGFPGCRFTSESVPLAMSSLVEIASTSPATCIRGTEGASVCSSIKKFFTRQTGLGEENQTCKGGGGLSE